MVETTKPRGSFLGFVATVLTFALCGLAFYSGRHEIASMLGYAPDVAAPATITATPTDAQRLQQLYAQPTSAPVAPQQAPIVIRVENADPAPVIAPQPAQQATAPADNSAEAQPTIAPPVVIVQRVTDSGGQVITGAGACRANNRVAKRCGK